MIENAGNGGSGTLARKLAGIVLLAALGAGCTQLDERVRGVDHERAALLAEIRVFARSIGFRETANFRAFSRERMAYSFCGYASRLRLPYSYEDPAIRWFDAVTEEQCRELGRDADVYFDAVEAHGAGGTAVTTAMATATLERFLYLVIHEDCHDQFDLPYGIEEALCNLVAYKAMVAFGERKFGASTDENRAIRGYTDGQSRHTRVVIGHYEQLAVLYGRHERSQISSEVLLRERVAIFSNAERALDWEAGDMNNVVIASEMTYRRHYPFLESVYDALGRDLARVVAFFRHVDRVKPTRARVRKRHGIATEESVEFIRAYEAAVVETVRKALAGSGADV